MRRRSHSRLASMPGTRVVGIELRLLQEGMAQVGKAIRHQLGLLDAGRQQNELREALRHHRGHFAEIFIAASKALLDEFVDIAMQAITHEAVSLGGSK